MQDKTSVSQEQTDEERFGFSRMTRRDLQDSLKRFQDIDYKEKKEMLTCPESEIPRRMKSVLRNAEVMRALELALRARDKIELEKAEHQANAKKKKAE